MLLFRSEDHRDRWLGEQGLSHGATMSLAQQWDLARTWYHDRHTSQWRRRTPAEAEAVFAGIGLTGPFWQLT